MSKTLYELLEVSETASPEIIRTSYQQICRRIERSADPQSEEALIQRTALHEAFAILSDPDRRRKYDERRTAATQLPEDQRSRLPLLLLCLALAAGGLVLSRQRAAEEAARAAAEITAAQQRAESLRLERERMEAEKARNEMLARAAEFNEDMRFRAMAERQAEAASRAIRGAEISARREQELQAMRDRAELNRRQIEIAQQLARDKAIAQRMEAENMMNGRRW